MVFLALAGRVTLVVVFACSAGSKVRSRAAYLAYREWLSGLRTVSSGAGAAIAPVLLGAEIATVGLCVVPAVAWFGVLLGVLVLLVLTVGALFVVRGGNTAPCRCFGVSATPFGRRHVVRNALLAAVAGLGLAPVSAAALQPAAVAVSVAGALVVSALLVFFDELVGLFTDADSYSAPTL